MEIQLISSAFPPGQTAALLAGNEQNSEFVMEEGRGKGWRAPRRARPGAGGTGDGPNHDAIAKTNRAVPHPGQVRT